MKVTIATGLILLAWTSGEAAPHRTAQRGAAIAVETRFKSDVEVRAATLAWQTYDSISSQQTDMASVFLCTAEVRRESTTVTLSCKIPFDAADGHYYLTSISVETSDSEREYSFRGDLPADIEIDVKGGTRSSLPNISSIQLK